MPNLMRAAITSGAVLAIFASQAQAATTVGQTAPTAAGVSDCGGATLFLTPQVAAGTPTYAVPQGGGVLTSWSVQGDDAAASTLELKVVRETAGNTYRVVAQDPQLRNIAVNILNTFSVRIPVTAGEMLALWVPAGLQGCTFSGVAGDVMEYRGGSHAEPGVGENFVTNTDSPNFRTNVSAVLEPDADDDGFGDETQDGCPTNATTQGPCPPPPDPSDNNPPETTFTKEAPNKTDKSKVKFKFSSDEAGSTFECKLDKKPFKPCTSPKTVKRLDEGKHRFKVRAIDTAGNVDPTADKDKFKVVD